MKSVGLLSYIKIMLKNILKSSSPTKAKKSNAIQHGSYNEVLANSIINGKRFDTVTINGKRYIKKGNFWVREDHKEL